MDTETYALDWRLVSAPPLNLAQFPLLTVGMALAEYDSPAGGWSHRATAVALATVLEYAAATYGPEHIPVLVAEAGRDELWATLIPAVFGVSVDEFETGWQSYLAQQYGVHP
jgi:hypothetical protein